MFNIKAAECRYHRNLCDILWNFAIVIHASVTFISWTRWYLNSSKQLIFTLNSISWCIFALSESQTSQISTINTDAIINIINAIVGGYMYTLLVHCWESALLPVTGVYTGTGVLTPVLNFLKYMSSHSWF